MVSKSSRVKTFTTFGQSIWHINKFNSSRFFKIEQIQLYSQHHFNKHIIKCSKVNHEQLRTHFNKVKKSRNKNVFEVVESDLVENSSIEFLRNENLKNTDSLDKPQQVVSRSPVFSIPNKYSFLTELPSIDKTTLASNEKLWELITSQPETTRALIKKEEALTCIAWAKDVVDFKHPIVSSATLNFSRFEKTKDSFGNVKKCVYFSVQSTDENFIALQMHENSDVKFKSLNGRDKFKGMSFRIVEVKPKTIILRTNGNKLIKKADKLTEKGKNSLRPTDDKKFESFKNEEVAIYDYQSNFIYRYTMEAINRIRTKNLKHFTDPDPTFKLSVEQFKESFNQILPALKDETGLNDLQAQALFSICTRSHGNAPFVLNGPPGTGKTRTIGQTVCYLLAMNTNNRILLTASSNMAADILALEIMKLIDGKLLTYRNVLRLYSTSIEFSKRDERLDSISYINGNSFDIPTNLDSYRVVICTLGSSAHIARLVSVKNKARSKNTRQEFNFFSHIFIDEAGQATNNNLWLPIGCLASEQTSIILCGDPKQLGPVSNFDDLEDVRIDSALLRYMKMPLYKDDPRVHCMLQNSYRCHPEILRIASQLFYDNKLLTAVKEREELLHHWRGLPKKNFPILFVDVKNGMERRCKDTLSYANFQEAEALIRYIEHLQHDFELHSHEIGVITPYTYQRTHVNSKLQKSLICDVHNLTVDSVERFQGSERRVILISATRTYDLGFLASEERLNTAITRAIHLLIIFGNKRLLETNECWKKLISYCKENNSVVAWTGKVKYF